MTAVSLMPSSKSLQMISQNTFQNLNSMQNISLLIFSFEIWLGKATLKLPKRSCLANKFQTMQTNFFV